MSSPIGGSSAPNVADKGVTEQGHLWSLEDGIPRGGQLLVLNSENLDARVKCGNCQMVTLHLGFPVDSMDEHGEKSCTLRIYGCTVCGNITTKRA